MVCVQSEMRTLIRENPTSDLVVFSREHIHGGRRKEVEIFLSLFAMQSDPINGGQFTETFLAISVPCLHVIEG